EGQLLVDQVIHYLKVPKTKLENVERCLISDLNPEAVKRALTNLRSNKEFIPLSVSALARSRADWLYGINMTRAYTLQGHKVGFQGLLSVGRVQTPVLGLVVRRDAEIDDFVSKPFYEVLAQIEMVADQGVVFKAKWQPSEACQPYQDEEGRVLNKALALNVISRIQNKPATVVKSQKKLKKQAPPLPYNLSTLQIEAARMFGYKAQQVLDSCQKLYERDKLITYPRSDCRYLPDEHFAQKAKVVDSLRHHGVFKTEWESHVDLSKKSKAWNDKKVTAHHAIIPTGKKGDVEKLNPVERNLYHLIARQYLMQFAQTHTYHESEIALEIEGGKFIAKANQVVNPGWKQLIGQSQQKDNSSQEKSQKKDSQEQQHTLPAVKTGDVLHCKQGELVEKQTQPPKYFTDATLLAAMTGISRYVQDPEIRKILRETDGLGTEATRAGIIELLFQRKFLQRSGKTIRATESGKALIGSLPDVARTPDMTARWEANLADISEGKTGYSLFMTPMQQSLTDLIDECKATLPLRLKGVKGTPPRTRKAKPSGKRSFKKPYNKGRQGKAVG
ncbi:MAG: DNA topoisomerase III, partial [Pseudomonadales bacterium]|nr:DNA topoisomerase III [Pseudomonadales bacterium]